MPWLGIFGHDAQRDALLRAYQQDRLGHSYLFVGPEGIGKKRFALAFAQLISCETVVNQVRQGSSVPPEPCGTCSACVQIKAGTYPDLQFVGLPEDKQEFPIALMQDLISTLSRKPSRAGSRRVLIIDDADVFSDEAANCFLKSLEEPPPDSLLILIGTAAEKQWPTIRSRCQVVAFQPLSQADFTAAALANGIVTQASEADALYEISQGSLAKAQLMKDPELQTITTEIAKALQSPKFVSVPFGTLLVKFVEGSKESAIKRQRAHFAVEFIVQLFRAALLQAETGSVGSHKHQPAITRLAALTNIEALPALIECCLETEYHIDRRLQLAMLLEAFADRMGRELR